MWHNLFIASHALASTVALVGGLVAHRGRTLFYGYLWALVASVAFLAAAVVEEWAVLTTLNRVLFAAFVVLGIVMVRLAVLARGLPLSERYVDLVGFTVVALFDAFVVITVLNLDAPTVLVVASGVGTAVVGHFGLRAVKSRLARQPAAVG